MGAEIVKLHQVSKAYGTVQAIREVSFIVQAGEFFTLLGASGSGKTTLLRLIGGFETPDTGTIWMNGNEVSRVPAYQRRVHTVFQDYALFPHLSVFENVAYSLNVQRCTKADIEERVTNALKCVQLASLRDRRPAQLSGGQRQRVALARAIVDRPDVLLLDEPLSALDAKIRVELRQELKQLQRQTGIGFIYITHDQEEALALSDRIAVMHDGNLLQVGTPTEIYEHPSTLYVSEFVGRANSWEGVLCGIDVKHAQVNIGEWIVEGTLIAELPLNAAVKLVIRPEHVTLVPNEAGNAMICQCQYLGYATRYIIKRSDLEVHVLELRRGGIPVYPEGTRVSLSWDWSEALIFPVTN
jgi:spermidine/putrescine transport system ATP-binding protein